MHEMASKHLVHCEQNTTEVTEHNINIVWTTDELVANIKSEANNLFQ